MANTNEENARIAATKELEELKEDKTDFYYDNPSAAIDTITFLCNKILELTKK